MVVDSSATSFSSFRGTTFCEIWSFPAAYGIGSTDSSDLTASVSSPHIFERARASSSCLSGKALPSLWRRLLFWMCDLSNCPATAPIVLLIQEVSAAHCAFEKDYVSCLVIIKRYKVLFRGTSAFALLDPLRVPIKTALVAVDEVARFLEAVELAGIDYEFGGNIEAAQGLIHLFAVK